MGGLAVEAEQLRREFRGGRTSKKHELVVALDDVTLGIHQGEVLGLLGPNGAGKTSFVKILSTVLLPTSGTARILGHDVVAEPHRVRPRIGLVFGGERGLYLRITARQNLRYWAALYKVDRRMGRHRTEELLDRVGLTRWADAAVETFSRGMKQRLHLARGLIGDPAVLFLDEPTTGMDPVAAREFRGLVEELRREQRTILLTTHDMAEAEALCDRVALIDHGRILAVESPRVLSGWLCQFERIDVNGAPLEALAEIGRLPGVTRITALADGWSRIEVATEKTTAGVLELLVRSGVRSLRTSMPTLEEVYFHVFGERGLKL